MSALLDIADLHVGYVSGVDILQGLSLKVERGSVTVVIGPNGAGKSTLLRTIFGLLKPQRGRIAFAGQEICGREPAGINPTIKDAIIELIDEENRANGITFIIVSHEMAIVRRLCRRVTVLVEGRVAAEGTLDEVAARGDVLAAYLGRGWT